MKQKKIPQRKCNGCGAQKPKKELVRVVRSPEGEVSLDLTGKKPGRGAYVCPNTDCLKKAQKAKRFERVLECAIPEAVYAEMEETLQNDRSENERDFGAGTARGEN